MSSSKKRQPLIHSTTSSKISPVSLQSIEKTNPLQDVKVWILNSLKKIRSVITASPFITFLTVFALLIVAIVIGVKFRKPEIKAEPEIKPLAVTTLTLGNAPYFKTQAQVEKTGVLSVVAQTAGYVQKISVQEGDAVKKNTTLFSISTNARGANASSVARSISAKNYQFVLDTYDTQKSNIELNKQLAEKAEDQSEELRSIARSSHEDTKSMISLNEEIVAGLDDQIESLEASNIGGSNDSAIVQIKASKSQILGALSGLRTGLRNSEYLNDESQESAELSRISKDVALKQLDLQYKSLELSKDLAYLNVKLAQISESLSFPTSPCPGTVERVFVKQGEYVNPGTVLAIIRADHLSAQAVALVPSSLVSSVSTYEPSTISISDTTLKLVPEYVSKEPTERGLHSVIYQLPEDISYTLANESTIQIAVPLQKSWDEAESVFVPLDALHFSQNEAIVYTSVETEGKLVAKSTPIIISEVLGDVAKVKSGISSTDAIILTRTVQDGQAISLEQKN